MIGPVSSLPRIFNPFSARLEAEKKKKKKREINQRNERRNADSDFGENENIMRLKKTPKAPS